MSQKIPCAEKVRILKNGSDATTGAVRMARAYTGRQTVLACHYHGWHDWYYISTSLNAGVPTVLQENIISFPYGDLSRLDELFKANRGKIAAIIMEATHLHAPEANYLDAVKSIAHKNGALLIFDEVVTGFRFGLGGAQTYYDVIPDIACFAKALGNGSPISLVAGTKEIMDSTQHVVTTQTYGEDCLAVAAALATLDVIEREPVVEHVWKLGGQLQAGYNRLAERYKIETECIGHPPRLQLDFSNRGNLKGNT